MVREGVAGWLTMLGRSPSRVVFLADADKGRYFVRDLSGLLRSWQQVPVPGVAVGVWGLSGDCVLRPAPPGKACR